MQPKQGAPRGPPKPLETPPSFTPGIGMLWECDVLLWYFTPSAEVPSGDDSPSDAGGLLRHPQKFGGTLCRQREGTNIPLLPLSRHPSGGKGLCCSDPSPITVDGIKEFKNGLKSLKIYYNAMY